MVSPTALKGAAASDVRSTPTSVPCVTRVQTYRDPIDDSSVVSGCPLPKSAPSPDSFPKIIECLLLPSKNLWTQSSTH